MRIEPMTGAHAAVLAIYRAGINEGNATFETRAAGWPAFTAARPPVRRDRGGPGRQLGGRLSRVRPLRLRQDRRAFGLRPPRRSPTRAPAAGSWTPLIASTEAAGIWNHPAGIKPLSSFLQVIASQLGQAVGLPTVPYVHVSVFARLRGRANRYRCADPRRRSGHHHLGRVRDRGERRRQPQPERLRAVPGRARFACRRHVPVPGAVPEPPGETRRPVVCANRSASCGMPLLTTCRWLSPAAMLSPARANRAPSTSGRTPAQRCEHLRAVCGHRRVAVRDDAGPLRRDLRCGRHGDAVPGRAEPLAQRGELAGYRAVGGDRARLGEHRDDLSRIGPWTGSPGVSAGQDAFGLQHEQAFAGRDRRGLRSAGGAARRPRAAGALRGSCIRRVPSPTRSSRRAPRGGTGDNRAMPRQVSRPAPTALEPDRVASPLVVHRPQLVVRQMMRAGPGDLQIRARPVRWPVHAHDDGDHGLGLGPHQRHQVQHRRRAAAGHPERPRRWA